MRFLKSIIEWNLTTPEYDVLEWLFQLQLKDIWLQEQKDSTWNRFLHSKKRMQSSYYAMVAGRISKADRVNKSFLN